MCDYFDHNTAYSSSYSLPDDFIHERVCEDLSILIVCSLTYIITSVPHNQLESPIQLNVECTHTVHTACVMVWLY